jgi:hypothetical protein
LGRGVDVDAEQFGQHGGRHLCGEIKQGGVARWPCSDSELLESEHEVAWCERKAWCATGKQPRVIIGVCEGGMSATVGCQAQQEFVQRWRDVQRVGSEHEPDAALLALDLIMCYARYFGQWLAVERDGAECDDGGRCVALPELFEPFGRCGGGDLAEGEFASAGQDGESESEAASVVLFGAGLDVDRLMIVGNS